MGFCNSISRLIKFICLFALIAMVSISVIIYHASAAKLLVFLLYIVFYIQIPGLFIIEKIGINVKYTSAKLLVSFFLSWILVIIEYFISAFIDTSILLYAVGPTLSIAYIYNSYCNETLHNGNISKILNLKNISTALLLFVVITLLYILLQTQYTYITPEVSASAYASKDKLYQMGLINSIASDYPIANPWVSGKFVYYHVFTQIFYAVALRLFHIESYFLIMSCAPYITTYVITLSVYSLFRYFSKKPNYAGLYSLTFVLSHLFITKGLDDSYFYRIFYVSDNFAAYGVAATIAWIISFDALTKNYDGSKKQLIKALTTLSLLLMLTTGIKAPSALVIIGALIGTFLLSIVLKSYNKINTLITLVASFSFIFIYKTIITSSTSSGGQGDSIFAFATMTGKCFWKQPLISLLEGFSVPPIIRLCFIMLFFFVSFFTIYFLPLLIGYLREVILVISKAKDFDFSRILVYACEAVGLILMLILNYSGHSQIYFGLTALVLAPLISIWFFEDVFCGNSSNRMKTIGKITACIFSVSLIFTSITLVMEIINDFDSALSKSNIYNEYDTEKSISNEEYAAMLWLKENTPEDSLIATQRQSCVVPELYSYQNRWVNCHFQYAVYSQRNFYIEGSGYSIDDDEWKLRRRMIKTNSKLYDSNYPNRFKLAKNLGIDYIVVSKDLGLSDDLSNKHFKKCFSNDTIDIYKVA